MKRLITWILSLTMVFTLTACSGGVEQKKGNVNVADMMEKTAQYLQNTVTEPGYGAIGGEWTVLGLARSGLEIPVEYFETYWQNISAYTAQLGGVLHNRKYTEYSRVILAVTAIGKDPADVGGYDLLVPLADFEQTVFQGINGPAFALIALDSGNYEIPENVTSNTQATRDMYVDYLISAQLADGGWSLSGGQSEVDLTAMALQALAKHQDRKDVADAVEKGLQVLSAMQNENGGFSSYEGETCESIAQTIVALTELGISLDDSRFVKNGNTLVDALVRFQLEDGSFSHILDDSGDLLATEQAFYALVATVRAEAGETSLYTMK